MIEAALLSSPQPLKLEALVRLFGGTMKKSQVQEQLARLQAAWQTRGLRLVETVDGWRFQCVSDVAQALMRISGQKPPKYSRAVLETLAIIAYRQPATRGDIEEIRGVAVNANVMRQLEERGWIEVVGHRETPGRPSLFATTKQFLTDLGLKSLSDLPPLAGTEPQYQEFELDLPDPREPEAADDKNKAGEMPVGGNVLFAAEPELAFNDSTETSSAEPAPAEPIPEEPSAEPSEPAPEEIADEADGMNEEADGHDEAAVIEADEPQDAQNNSPVPSTELKETDKSKE